MSAPERQLSAVGPIPFTVNGTSLGVVTVADATGFYIKQRVYVQSNTQPEKAYKVTGVIGANQLVLGLFNGPLNINNYVDLSAYTVTDNAIIYAPQQAKSPIPGDDHYLDVYEPAPVSGDRVIQVDPRGNFYGPNNPFPIAFDGTVQIGDVSIVEGGNTMKVNADGSINVIIEETPVSGQVVISNYNQVINVVSGATTTLLSYTVPMGYTAVLEKANASGENVARFDILYNSNLFDTKRTYWGGGFNVDFDYTTGTSNGISLNSGDVIIIQVLHTRPYVGTFNARIQILQIAP